ncbi:MAG: AAA family ATPase [Clostridiales bacterium]|jgi:predicted ATPase|nr:AAA family ATPase [Clostridiales bacterium]
MLKSVEVKGLFGTFDYAFELKEGGITILTGPNGFGKSTILGMINSVAAGDVYGLLRVPFDAFTLTFADKKRFELKKTETSLTVGKVGIEGVEAESYKNIRLHQPGAASGFVRGVRAAYGDRGEELSAGQTAELGKKIELIKAAYQEAAAELGAVQFIRDQRLLTEEESGRDRRQVVKTVGEIPEKLNNRIDETLLAYTEAAEALDETYPERLCAVEKGVSAAGFEAAMRRVAGLRARLKNYGFIKTDREPARYHERYAAALGLYAEDQLKKLAVFEPLLDRLDTFTGLINEKLKFKRLLVSRREGLFVTDLKTGVMRLPLSALSSGEQQIIIFYYRLVFESEDRSMLLIDEPEISLHIAWQLELVGDLKRILAALKNQTGIIIATHSPQVLTGNWELQVDLGEMYED